MSTEWTDRRFQQGLEQFRQADYPSAIRTWKALLDEGAPHPNLPLYLWAAQSEYGRMLETVENLASNLGTAIEVGPDAMSQALAAFAARRFGEALDLLTAIASEDPELFAPRLLGARAAMRAGRLSAGLALAREAVALRTSDVRGAIVLGQLLAEMGRPLEAEAAFRSALAISDRAAGAWCGLAALARGEQRWAEAEGLLERALGCEPGHDSAEELLAEVQRERRRAQAALEECRRILAEHPAWADWQLKRGVLAAGLGLAKEAHDALDRALELNNRLTKAWVQKALLFRAGETPQQACDALRQAAAMATSVDHGLAQEAERQASAGRLTEAIFTWMRALALVPDYGSRHIEAGKRFFGEGLLEEAERELTRGLSLAPHYADGHHGLGRVMLARQRSADAIPHFKAALSLNPLYCEAAMGLVEAFHASGNVAAAKLTLEQWRPRLETSSDFGASFRELEKRASRETRSKTQARKTPRSPAPPARGGSSEPRRQQAKASRRRKSG